MNPIGLGFAAVIATTSLAMAGGGGEDEKKAKEKARKEADTQMLEKLAASPGRAQDATLKAAPGEGITIEVGDEFSLTMRNRIQAVYTFTDNDNTPSGSSLLGTSDRSNFGLRRARTSFSGHVYDKTKTYRFEMDWSNDTIEEEWGDPNDNNSSSDLVFDAWFDWDFWQSEDAEHDIGLRFGLQKPHFGREFTFTSEGAEHTRRSVASLTFTGYRVLGAWLHGTHMEGDKLHWWVGVGNGDPAIASSAVESGQGASNEDNEMNFYFNLRFDPFGDAGDEQQGTAAVNYSDEARGSVGAAVMIGNLKPGDASVANFTNNADVDTTAVSIYTNWQYQGLSLLGEVFLREDESDFANASSDSMGATVSAGYVMQPAEEGGSQWGFAARWSMVDIDDVPLILTNNPLGQVAISPVALIGVTGDIQEVTGSITNYYRKNALKSQLSMTWLGIDPDIGSDRDTYILEALFQWAF